MSTPSNAEQQRNAAARRSGSEPPPHAPDAVRWAVDEMALVRAAA